MAEFKLGRLRFVWQGAWTTGTSYVKDDIVRYGGSSYVCVKAHTAAADFYTNFDLDAWQLMTSGLQWVTEPWTTGVFYPEGSVVRYGGKLYVAVDGHTSSADFNTDFDAADWQLFVDGIQWKTDEWAGGTLYKEGDLVRHGGRVYIAIDGHTASSSFKTDFDSAEWQLFADGVQWKTSEWTASTLYLVGDVVRVSGKTYIATVEHTANAVQRGGFYFDLAGNWNLYTDGIQYQGAWDTDAYYWIGDLVRYGGKTYICVAGHEADADFYVDFDSTKWNLFNDGFQWASSWTSDQYYKEGDVVKHGGTTYICLNGHTSTDAVDETGFDADLTANQWAEFSAGFDWKNQWTAGTYYKLNDLVRYGARSFICVSGHTASVLFNDDIINWELLTDGQQWLTSGWQIGTFYKERDIVRYGGRTYICAVGHTATSFENRFDIDFDAGNWQLFTDGTQWKNDAWTAATYYKIGDIVKYGGKTYVAVDDHLANAVQDGGFYVDSAKWNLYADGTEWRKDWTVTTYYAIGDIVRYDGNVYVCQIPHTSAATISAGLEQDLDADLELSKWRLFSEGFKYKGTWDTATKYNVNDVVKFGGSLYICVDYHTSISNFEELYWNTLVGGLEFEDTWNPSVEYQIGDVVTYGGYSYISQARNTGKIPSGFNEDWNLLTTGFKVTGEWSDTRAYKVGELVSYGGSSYVAVVETGIGQRPSLPDGSTSLLWEEVAPGISWKGEWVEGIEYRVGDAVKWVSNSYICKIDHVSAESSLNQPDNDSLGVYWDSLVEGAEGNKLARRGDLLTRDATQNKRLPRGQVGQVLQVQGNDVAWDFFNVVDNVYYVDINGEDAPDRGISLQTAFRTIKYASEYILADEATRAPATIFVKTGSFKEQLPIIIPANVALVGDELRSTRIEPAVNSGIASATVTEAGTGYTSVPTVVFQDPENVNGNVAEGIAVVQGGQVVAIQITNPGSGYITVPLVALEGGNPSSAASAIAVLKSKPYNQTNMFYVRDGAGLRNCTVAGLNVSLGPENQYFTRRPVTDCAFVSLDPGTGPGDESAWIVNRSPYVQNVTTFGSGAVGMKVDGSLHNGGARTIVCNDFTQVISDGIGIWCTNQGRSECVSVFSYYAHIGYLSEDGGVIRGTGGNSSYGTFGVASEGVDPSEVSRIATVDNRKEEAQIINTLTDGDGIVVLEYLNAGENYQAGNTTYEFGGSGVVGSIDIDSAVVQDGGVKEVRVLAAGQGWLSVTNNAQGGDNVSIRLSASDVQVTNAYVGERIVLIDGQGVGQYAYVVSFNGGTKLALVAIESTVPLIASSTAAATDTITVSSTSLLTVNQRVGINGAEFGGLEEGVVYYVKTIVDSTTFTVSETSGGTVKALTDGSGTMNVHALGWESLHGQAVKVILDTTSRYTIEPRVEFSTGAGATASASISPGADLVTVVTGGGFYQANPTAIIIGNGDLAVGAEATTTITGSVTEVKIREGGSGFTFTPNVQFINGGLSEGDPNHATGTANVTGKITSISLTNRGSGYDKDVLPQVVVSGDGYNNDAYISVNITNIVGTINVVSAGTNYTTVPNVIITGGGGSGAQAIANLNASVTGVALVEGGSGYTDITTLVTVVPDTGDTTGDGATVEFEIDGGVVGGPGVITSITVLTPGTGYTKPPKVIITSTGLGEDAEAIALINGGISFVTMTQGGSNYTSAPNVAFGSGSASAIAEITGAVDSLDIISGGTGFTGSALIQILNETPATGATAVATVSRVVESVTLTSSGTGYTSLPTVSISGGGGVGALASSILDAEISSVTVTKPGSGYQTIPTISFAGAHNFKSIVAGESYYRNASSIVAISDLQLTQTLDAMNYVKLLAGNIATNTDPSTAYQSTVTRSGSTTASATAIAQTNLWVDVIKAIAYNGTNATSAEIILDNKNFIAAEAIAWADLNDSGGVTYTSAGLRKQVKALVDALTYDLTAGTAERTVAIGQQFGNFVPGETAFSSELLSFINSLMQDIIVNTAITKLNAEGLDQTFAEIGTLEIKSPTAILNLINLIDSINNLNSVVGDTANSVYTDLLITNKLWIQAEVTEYIKQTYPDFEYNQTLCARDVGYIVDAVAGDVRYAASAIPSATVSTINVLSSIAVDTAGAGYGNGTTVSFTGDVGSGTAPTATTLRNNLGEITGFVITNPGKGYTAAPGVTITADTGSGAFARAFVLGGQVQDIRIIHPGSGYNAPPFVKLIDPNNTIEGRWQVRIGDGVLDQPNYVTRGTGYLAVKSFVSSPTGYADIFQVGEFVEVDNLTDIPTPGANIQFGDNPIFYKLVTIRNLIGDEGLIGGRTLIAANRAFVQRQIVSYINTTFPLLVYNQDLCFRDTGLIVDAISADIFGNTERGIEAGKSYFRNASSIASITGNQLTATLSAIDKIQDYLTNIVQNIDVPRNQLFELQVKEPNITGGNSTIAPMTNTLTIVKDIIQNGNTIYGVQDLLLDNKPYIQAEVLAFINTTYPEFAYNEALCNRDVGLIVDALAYDLFAGLGAEGPVPKPGLARSREAGVRYYSNESAKLAITQQLGETVAAINHIKTVASAVIQNQAPVVQYQSTVFRQIGLTTATPTLLNRLSSGVDEIINIISNGLSVLPVGTYSARLQISPSFTVDNVPSHDATITIRSKYSQVRISGHDFLNVGTGNKAATNYPGLPVNAPEKENEVLEQGGGRCFYTSTDQDGNFRVGELFSVEQATGIATLNADAFNLSGLNELSLGGVNLGGTGATVTEFSTDSTFFANSDGIVPTQRAIKTYIASQLGSGGGNLAVNAITAGDIQISGNELSTNDEDGMRFTAPSGMRVTENIPSTSATSGSLVIDGGLGVAGNIYTGGQINVGSDLVVAGNLTVNGTQTTLNVGTLSVEDINVTIAKDAADAAAANGAGLTVNGPAVPATITYANADDSWNFNKAVKSTSVQNTPIGSVTRNTGAFTTLTSNGATTFTSTASSTGTNNGAVVVSGGVGVEGNLNVGGTSKLVGVQTSGSVTLSPVDASVQVNPSGTGGVVISPTGAGGLTVNPTTVGTVNNVNIGTVSRGTAKFTTLETNGNVLVTSATAATSVDSGALQVDGGVGINGAVYAGSIQNTPVGSTTANSGRFTSIESTSATASTSTTTGAARIAGGLGVQGAIWAGSINVGGGGIDNTSIGETTRSTGKFTTLSATGATTVTVNTSSTSTATGALVVTGGVGVGENLNVGGQLTVTGNLVVNGTTTTINSTTLSVDDVEIELGQVASPTDITADGGGIRLKGTTDKLISWSNATKYWTFNQPVQASSVENTPIGSATRNTGAFTTLTANSATTFTANTASSNTTTGTLVVSGGVGVSGQVTAATLSGNHTGGSGAFTTLTTSSTTTLSPPSASVTISPTGTGTVTIAPATAGSINNMSIGTTTRAAGAFTTLSATSTFSVTDSTESSTTTTGAFVVAGGIGVAKQATLNNVRITATTAATSVDSGALQVDGGVGINGAVYAGSLQNTPIGSVTRNTGAFTTLTANSATTFTANTASTTTGTGTLVVTGGVGISGQLTAASIVETSSIVYKEDITPIDNALSAIMQLVGVTYARKDTHKYEAGLIAEEVDKVLPNLVSKNADGSPEGIQYTKLTAYLIEAVKSLKAEIDELKGNK
jgi:hypothetical protein